MPLDAEEISAKLARALSDEFEVPLSSLTPDAPLVDTLRLDSLDMVNLVILIENETGIHMQRADFQGIETYAQLVEQIVRKSNE